ncbi:hypothetical protein RZS08_44380, partial [Arthrospira platensis SPKY1]|nr:hypothetical protein [Arthrospira platensis SPKY1]
MTVEPAATSNPQTWTMYDLVIVSSGGNTTPFNSTAMRQAVTSYRAAGGKLLVEGGEVAYRLNYNDVTFLRNVLYVQQWNGDNAGNVTVADANHHVMSVPNVIPATLPL